MTDPHLLQTLRRRVGALNAVATARPQAPIALGDGVIDEALPGRGLAAGTVHELLPETRGDFAATLGFGIGLLVRLSQTRPCPVLWIASLYEMPPAGIVYPAGLASFGFDPGRLHYLAVAKAEDALWAMEEALASASLAAVVGVLPAKDRLYDFTASRRLSLRAAESGVTAFLIRHHTSDDKPTAAVTRWSIAARPSTPVWRRGLFMPGPGKPRWAVNLMRCKRGRPRTWLVEWNHETLSFRVASPLADRTSAVAGPERFERTDRQHAAS